jgi:hypothetical protein
MIPLRLPWPDVMPPIEIAVIVIDFATALKSARRK